MIFVRKGVIGEIGLSNVGAGLRLILYTGVCCGAEMKVAISKRTMRKAEGMNRYKESSRVRKKTIRMFSSRPMIYQTNIAIVSIERCL